ncbi:hypothetical protein SDC9_65289 [bioreactor metagenome]|uniref:Polymerase/histidinol phosphatase N-terminal domain-containing protein n=1 Tax=bioreactor metagenome TaxID=1076179 RepID=A0A644XRL1_9ZZZZ
MDYVGTRWYKCDFHLHTMMSECYKEKTDTPEEWMEKIKQSGLDCIAVTDHNDYHLINKMQEIGKEKDITVFPGVEITCDSSKIHMLVLFDSNKSNDKVRDFLSKCDIDTDLVGKNIGTSMSIFEVCEIAKEKGALVIAAHIDEYSGINSMSVSNIEKILNRKYIDAVQVVNTKAWNIFSETKDKSRMLGVLKEKYGEDFSLEEAEGWRKTYERAKKEGVPILTFSDNPCALRESKHGLWGIGQDYTWLKMDKNPNLESIRQALLSEEMRVRIKDESESIPEKMPMMWIKSICFKNTKINPYAPVNIELNPQLNSIIGGRGSGKSAVVRLLAGALTTISSYTLKGIKDEQTNFYKEYSNKDNLGVFAKNSLIEILIYRNNILYKIIIESIESMEKQTRKLFKFSNDSGTWEEILDSNYFNFLRIQAYTQKQIFEIGRDPDALLKIIDLAIPGIEKLVIEKNAMHESLIAKMAEIRSVENVISKEGELQLELKDCKEQIDTYKRSGIANLLELKQKYLKEEKIISDYLNEVLNIATELKNSTNRISIPNLIMDNLEVTDELGELINVNRVTIIGKVESIQKIITEIDESIKELKNNFEKTKWHLDKEMTNSDYENACHNLTIQGIAIEKLDELLLLQKQKQTELETIEKSKNKLQDLIKEKGEIYQKYLISFENIRKERTDFIQSVLKDEENVKIDLFNHSDKTSFENMIKEVTQKEGVSINEDIEYLEPIVFGKKGIEEFRRIITDIRNGAENKSISAVLRKAIRSIDAGQFDKMLSFIPEDELSVSYRPEGSRSFISLLTASAGQKTTAILTFILSYGEIPLLLDQPEDDLDNKLVYDLVVKRLKVAKQKRQIVVVTHNANIPVNGDAEYIASMDSESKYVKVKCAGTIDHECVRKEICDVMEGTEHAFEMRAKKYHFNIIE